jgi:hypothetical protein
MAIAAPGHDAFIWKLIRFQEGPIHEEINGVHNEQLLAVVIDRLRAWQVSEFACGENAAALACLEEAMAHLEQRTERRRAAGTLDQPIPETGPSSGP